MKEFLVVIATKLGNCVLDCMGRRAWRKRKERKQKEQACKAANDCHNYLPHIVGRTLRNATPADRARVRAAKTAGHPRVVRKFGPAKGKRYGKQRDSQKRSEE